MLSTRQLTTILLAVLLLFATIFFLNGSPPPTLNRVPPRPQPVPDVPPAGAPSANFPLPAASSKKTAISYDKTTPLTAGCEDIVYDLQRELIAAYTVHLKGIHYANVYGYLETENKGDAAIWAAQQILLTMLGVTSMEACRFIDQGCDLQKFKSVLEEHKPYSAIIMAGGGNFNDYYTEDHPSRIKMIETFKDVPIRAFPQSIHMEKPDMIQRTKEAFGAHNDLQLAARDRPSYEWLEKTFGPNAQGVQPNKVRHSLVPDIAFMFGNRPDIRRNTNKTSAPLFPSPIPPRSADRNNSHQILILARDDMEIAEGDSSKIPMGTGLINLGDSVGNVTYRKVDWKFTKTPGIDEEEIVNADGTKTIHPAETGKNQRAFAKAMNGFQMLASADLVITDRLHGHIMSTIIGTPHVIMDSKLKKNLYFHDTWTKDCACTRVAESIDDALAIARLFFEKEKKDGKKVGS
jgi:exopolysaccharide biosynthesis predicted pyruvyltransferase EpsI